MNKKYFVIVLSSILLVACGGSSGPSEKAIRKIINEEFAQMEALMSFSTSEKELKEIRKQLSKVKIKINYCNHEEDVPAIYGGNAYSCEAKFTMPASGSQKESSETRKFGIYKEGSDWIAMQPIIMR